MSCRKFHLYAALLPATLTDGRGEREEGEEMEHMGDAAEYSAARLAALHDICSVR